MNVNIPIVKEWGSWVVFISSCIAALIAGLSMHPVQTGREIYFNTLLTVSGLTLLINSKNPLVSIIRTKGENREQLKWFMFFFLAGIVLLVPFLRDGLGHFLVFSVLVISYMLILSLGKEHHILAELNGFALITLPAPVVYFVITGEMSIKLYVAVFMFFAAGVFKVKVRVKKSVAYRILMWFYCLIAVIVFYGLKIPVILLLPMIENIVSIIWMREEKLRVTGYTELTKGVVFLVLMIFFW